ncbi:protein SPEAR3 [Senna tora]|uniref:Protein SPEAR3 n=1 Tax=Senna tora TaxID=362788 RepID=A0A834W852_9FABA|nr:protein SPEAR3 [Senna tora]
MGNERGRGGGGYNNINHPSSSSSSSSSRKGKKNNSDQKPKLPQRGLGVAQLEKIRLHGQISSCAAYHHPSLHPPPHFPPNSTFINIHHDDPRVQIAAYSSSSSSSSSTSYAASYAFHPNVVVCAI